MAPAIKYAVNELSIPKENRTTHIVHSIVRDILCDTPDNKNCRALALEKGYIPIIESGWSHHFACPYIDNESAKK